MKHKTLQVMPNGALITWYAFLCASMIDLISQKYDNCNTDGSKPEVRYPVMRDALNKTGRHIFFSMCEWY